MNREIHLVVVEHDACYAVETYTTCKGVVTGSVRSMYYKPPTYGKQIEAGLETHIGFVKDMLSHG